MLTAISIVHGAVAMASLTVAMFFLRFWRTTHDRFFLLFAISFGAEAVNRIALSLELPSQEQEPFFYLVRLFSFGLILVAIIMKNRGSRR